MSDLSTTVSVVSAVAAAGGLGFSGWQMRLLLADRQEERRLGVDGVSASWHPKVRPNESDRDPGGQAVWQFVFRVDNPGRFPISDVNVHVHFDLDVERIEHGGIPTGITRSIDLHHPVLPGGGSPEWSRRLQMNYAERAKLHTMRASVEFLDVDGARHSTTWPRASQRMG